MNTYTLIGKMNTDMLDWFIFRWETCRFGNNKIIKTFARIAYKEKALLSPWFIRQAIFNICTDTKDEYCTCTKEKRHLVVEILSQDITSLNSLLESIVLVPEEDAPVPQC